MSKKKRKLRGTVEKVIQRSFPEETEKVQIGVHEADELYREIRVDNTLTDDEGEAVQLKPGAGVDVILEADSTAIVDKDEIRRFSAARQNKKREEITNEPFVTPQI